MNVKHSCKTVISAVTILTLPYAQQYVPGKWLIWANKPYCPEGFVCKRIAHSLNIYELTDTSLSLTSVSKSEYAAYVSKTWEKLKQDPNILISQPVRKVNLRQMSVSILQPDDPCLPYQWHLLNTSLINVRAQETWNIIPGVPLLRGTQDTVVLGMIDADLDTQHVDLHFYFNHAEIPGDSLDNDSNGFIDDYYGWDFYANVGTLSGSPGHGTRVASFMSAITNNGVGGASIGWNIPVFAAAGASINESIVVSAMAYMYEFRKRYNEGDPRGILITAVNMSFGVDYGDPASYPVWCAMYDTLGKVGILSVAATTNNQVNVDSVGDIPSLCSSDFLIVVTSLDANGNLTGGWGPQSVDIASPGYQVVAALPDGSCVAVSGTSFAAPQITSTIGAMYTVLCDAWLPMVKAQPDILALKLKSILLSSVTPFQSLSGKIKTSGYLNSFRAVFRTFHCDTMDYNIAGLQREVASLQFPAIMLLYTVDGRIIASSTVISPQELHTRLLGLQPGTYILRICYGEECHIFYYAVP